MSTTAFTLVMILVAFGYLQPSAAEITVKDFHGNWYVNAMIMPVRMGKFTCFFRHVTQGEGNTFHVNDSFLYNGLFETFDGAGKIENSTEFVEYEDKNKQSVAGVMRSYNNGESLIVHYKVKEGDLYMLHSRKRTADDETFKELQNIAESIHLPITTIKQDHCL